MNTFEITVQRKVDGAWPVVVEEGKAATYPIRREGIFHLDENLRAQLTQAELDPKSYGNLLGKALFQDGVRDAFVQARAGSEDRLRVLLFVEANDLKPLRWERLCAPLDGKWEYLALDQRVPFSLYLPSITDRSFPPIGRRDLRALVVAASPEGLEQHQLHPFDVVAAVASVRDALGEIPCEVLSSAIGSAGPPTLDALAEHLTVGRSTLLHLVCHGKFAGGETQLYLADNTGQIDRVSATRLLERLSRLRGARGLPHFVFLATCESARPDAEGAFGGLAQRLVQELGIPAVVAMTDRVSVETAQALASHFYRRLAEHGEVDRALVEATAGLAERYDIIVPALYSRLGGRPLFSNSLDRPLTNDEIDFGLSSLVGLLQARAPVLLPSYEQQAATIRGSLGVTSAAMSEVMRQERARALAEINAICLEVLDLTFNALALGQPPPSYDKRCPFRGLASFRAEDREFFFGREPLVQRLTQRLIEHNFLAVLGPSGSGKSSVVLAGLVPALQVAQPSLRLAYLTPGSDPDGRLQASLASVTEQQTVIVVDQFEELFTLCTDEEKRRTFIERLLAIAEHSRVVLTMRADFWGECAPYHQLAEQMQAHQELVAPMDAADLRRAMEMQAEAVGLRFEANLANLILDEVQAEPGAMPLLQHTLLELWNRRHGRWLRTEEYRAIGGAQGAIAHTADDVYDQLAPEEQRRVREIFEWLTWLDESTGPDEPPRDTRWRVELESLVPVGGDEVATKMLIAQLATARLVVVSVHKTAHGDVEVVEVAHEALIRHWPRLTGWIDEDRAALHVRQRLMRAAQEWDQRGRDDAELYRGKRLVEAVAWRQQHENALTNVSRDFLNASEALQRRERLRSRLTLTGLAAALTMICAIGIFAWMRNQQVAQQQAASRSRDIAQVALSQLEVDPELGVLLAAEAVRIAHTPQAEEALRQALLTSRGRATFRGHTGPVSSVAFSPDGTRVVTAGEDTTARLWNLSAGGTPPVTLSNHTGKVNNVAFSADGRFLATASADGTARLWDSTGRALAELRGHNGGVTEAVFHPSREMIATAGADGSVRLWEVPSGRLLSTLGNHNGPVSSIAFNPNEPWLLTASDDGTARVWHVNAGDLLSELRGHDGAITRAAFSPKGDRIVTASADKTARLWQVNTDQPVATLVAPLNEHTSTVIAATFAPDGSKVLTASFDGTARLWDATTGQSIVGLRGHTGPLSHASFSPDGQQIVTASADKTARLWDANTGQNRGELRGHTGVVSSAAFDPSGRQVITASFDQTARLWDSGTAQGVTELRGHRGAVSSAAFSPDGRRVITASEDRTARVWNLVGRSLMELSGHTAQVTSATFPFSRDGRFLLTSSVDGTARLWDASTGDSRLEFRGHDGWIYTAVFSPDDQRVVTAGHDKTARVWDTNSGRPLLEIRGHTAAVTSASFNPSFS
ncbi:MAG TPA: CHAT domain-containing protein, partial [Chloroflexota bacterium]|nr:CHAT domain-containing protein [Chloroflexota bacterium]